MLVSGFFLHVGFLLGGGEKFNFSFGWIKILVCFNSAFCNFLGSDIIRGSSLFELTMLDAFG